MTLLRCAFQVSAAASGPSAAGTASLHPRINVLPLAVTRRFPSTGLHTPLPFLSFIPQVHEQCTPSLLPLEISEVV